MDITERLATTGRQGIYLAGQNWYVLAGVIWDEGGELAEDSGGDWKGALDSPAALRGMDFYRTLQTLGSGPKDADEQSPPETDAFAGGEVAQIISVPGSAALIEQQSSELKGKLGYFPIPGKNAKKPGAVFTGGSDLIVPEGADQRGEGIEVVKALAGPATPNSPYWPAVEADNPIKPYMTAVLEGGDPAEEAKKASDRITSKLISG